MQTSKTKLTGILLAGGMSRRMGSEKGTLRIGDALLYEYPLHVLEMLCDEILISTCKKSMLPVPYPKVCDEIPGIGPLGGIYSCLKQSSNDLNLVLSYDMPVVNESLFRLLIGKKEQYDIVLPAMQENLPEPLCGLYSKNVIGLMEQMIAEQDFTVHHLLTRCHSGIIQISEEMECWQAELFMNINRKEDLHRLPPGFGTKSNE